MKKVLNLLLVVLALTGMVPGLMLASAQAQTLVSGLPDFADLVERVGPAVVNIRTTERSKGPSANGYPQMPEGMDENDPFYEFFRRFFPPRQSPGPERGGPERGGRGEEVPRGVGSGFFISDDGFLLTNHHVVDGADEIYVTLTDKREFKGKLIGSDKRTDVALVKIEAGSLPKLSIGSSSSIRVGEWVVAIGSPFGLDNTVTAGIVSAKGRETGEYLPFIQTDVAVNPGNSGGPLLNLRGEVVGINSQIYSRTGGFMGISFAIPIDEAMRVADQLKSSGRVVRGRIGVGIADVTKEVAEALGLKPARGALIRSIEAGGPAERAGIEVGDIILEFNGRPINKVSDLPRLVGSTRPGTEAPLRIWRKGETRKLQVTVAEMKADRGSGDGARKGKDKPAPAPVANALGLVVSDLNAERKSKLRIRSGVLVETAEGAAARAGLRAGDVLLSLDNQDIVSAEQFNDLVAKLDQSKTHVVLVRRGDSAGFVPIRPVQPAR
jgi:serine protease Do